MKLFRFSTRTEPKRNTVEPISVRFKKSHKNKTMSMDKTRQKAEGEEHEPISRSDSETRCFKSVMILTNNEIYLKTFIPIRILSTQ